MVVSAMTFNGKLLSRVSLAPHTYFTSDLRTARLQTSARGAVNANSSVTFVQFSPSTLMLHSFGREGLWTGLVQLAPFYIYTLLLKNNKAGTTSLQGQTIVGGKAQSASGKNRYMYSSDISGLASYPNAPVSPGPWRFSTLTPHSVLSKFNSLEYE